MNFRSSGVAACLLAAVTAGCGTVTASSSGGGAHSTTPAVPAPASAARATGSEVSTRQSLAPSALTTSTGVPPGCQRPAGDVLTLASNGKTYCVKVGEKFDVYLRGTVASRWLVPRVSGNALVGAPNGALSLIAGVTGASFRAARPGRVLITSVRPPCQVAISGKNEAEPASSVPTTYPLRSCAPSRRFSVVIVVTR